MNNPKMPAANKHGVSHLYIDSTEKPAVAAELRQHARGSFNPEKWIAGAVHPSKEGSLRKSLGAKKGKNIPRAKLDKALHSKNPKLRARAQFAANMRKFNA